MNTAEKLTVSRFILTLFIIFIMLFPFYAVGFSFPKILVEGVLMDTKYLVAGGLFAIAAITDFFDGYLARKKKMVTEFGTIADALTDKILVDSVLIIFASSGFINPIIPVVLVIRDCLVNAIKMAASSKGKVVSSITSGKIKTASLMLGIILLFFYNMPFEIYNIRIDLFLLYFALIMSIVSMVEYYSMNKMYLFPKKKN